MKTLLRQIIRNFHGWQIPSPIPRDLDLPKLPSNVRKAFVLMGIRRSGKTWLLYQKMRELLADGIRQEQMLYINFEDDRLSSFQIADFDTLLQTYYELYPEYANRSDVYFFLDEIHIIDGWEKFVRRLVDQELVQVYVTGSSAKMLSRELATTLRGRVFALEVFPFSFREVMNLRDLSSPLTSKQQAAARHLCRHYLEFGGFPESLDLPAPVHRTLLQDYMNVVIFRDVVERHEFRNVTLAKLFFMRCMRQLGSLFSVRKLHRNLKSEGHAVGINTLYELLDYFEEAYALFAIPIYAFSEKKQKANPQKLYSIDPGVLRAYTVKPGFDEAAALENAVFIELRHQCSDIYYYHTKEGREVNFLTMDADGSFSLIQVCIDLSEEDTFEREVWALVEAAAELQLSTGNVVTWDHEESIVREGIEIHFHPFWKWAGEKR